MSASLEIVRDNIEALEDVELLRRWHSDAFTSDARVIAEQEIRKRGLDLHRDGFAKLVKDENDSISLEIKKFKSRRFVGALQGCIIAGGYAGTLQSGWGPVPGIIVACLFEISFNRVAFVLDRKIDSGGVRFIAAAFVLFLSFSLSAFLGIISHMLLH